LFILNCPNIFQKKINLNNRTNIGKVLLSKLNNYNIVFLEEIIVLKL